MIDPFLIIDIVKAGRDIYAVARQVKGNKEQCLRLAERIQLVVETLSRTQEKYQSDENMIGLQPLHDCIKACAEFIEKFKNENWVLQVLLAGLHQEDFTALNSRLSGCAQQLQLDMQIQMMLVDKETDQRDRERDFKELQAQQTTMITLLTTLAGQQKEGVLRQNDFHSLVLQQLVRIQVMLHQTAQSSPSAPSPSTLIELAEINAEQLFQNGKLKEQAGDYSSAFKLYFQSAQQGNADAQHALGMLYVENKGVNPDTLNAQHAYYWLLQAAQKEHLVAQYNLGYALEKGIGMPSDLPQSVYWYKKVAPRIPSDKKKIEKFAVESAKAKIRFYEHIESRCPSFISDPKVQDELLKSIKATAEPKKAETGAPTTAARMTKTAA